MTASASPASLLSFAEQWLRLIGRNWSRWSLAAHWGYFCAASYLETAQKECEKRWSHPSSQLTLPCCPEAQRVRQHWDQAGDLLNSSTGGKVRSGICSTNMIFFILSVFFFYFFSPFCPVGFCTCIVSSIAQSGDGHHVLHCSSVPGSAPGGWMQNEASVIEACTELWETSYIWNWDRRCLVFPQRGEIQPPVMPLESGGWWEAQTPLRKAGKIKILWYATGTSAFLCKLSW